MHTRPHDAPGGAGDRASDESERDLTPEALRARRLEHARQIALVCLVVLTVIAGVLALRWGAALLIPLVLSVLVAMALDPLVRGLERLRLPRHVAAGVVVASVVLGLGGGAYGLSDEFAEAAQQLPEASRRIREELRDLRQSGTSASAIDAINRAADDLEAAASEAAGASPQRPEPPTVDVGLREWLVVGSMSAVGWTGQILLLVFFVYFLLASDDLFKRKFVRLAGPALGARRMTVAMLDGIHASMERFVTVTLAMTGFIVGATFVAYYAYGLESSALWATLGGLLNLIPYVGSALAAGIFFVAALLQFDTLGDATAVAAIFVIISSIEGTLLKPWLIGRTARINNVAVFASLFFWGWVWGAWGLVLAYPILMVVKIVSDHSEPLQPLSELLGQ